MVRRKFALVGNSLIFETLRVIAMVTVAVTVAAMEVGMAGATAVKVAGIGGDTMIE